MWCYDTGCNGLWLLRSDEKETTKYGSTHQMRLAPLISKSEMKWIYFPARRFMKWYTRWTETNGYWMIHAPFWVSRHWTIDRTTIPPVVIKRCWQLSSPNVLDSSCDLSDKTTGDMKTPIIICIICQQRRSRTCLLIFSTMEILEALSVALCINWCPIIICWGEEPLTRISDTEQGEIWNWRRQDSL